MASNKSFGWSLHTAFVKCFLHIHIYCVLASQNHFESLRFKSENDALGVWILSPLQPPFTFFNLESDSIRFDSTRLPCLKKKASKQSNQRTWTSLFIHLLMCACRCLIPFSIWIIFLQSWSACDLSRLENEFVSRSFFFLSRPNSQAHDAMLKPEWQLRLCFFWFCRFSVRTYTQTLHHRSLTLSTRPI